MLGRVLSLRQLSGAAAGEGGREEAEGEEEGRSREEEEGKPYTLPPTPARPTQAATCAPVRHRAVAGSPGSAFCRTHCRTEASLTHLPMFDPGRVGGGRRDEERAEEEERGSCLSIK